MKRTFVGLTTILASIIMLVVGCSNASQITWKNSSSNFTSDGLSEFKVGVGVFSNNARTIYPVTWTEEFKSKLVFHLHGDTNDGGYSKSITDMGADAGRFYTYEQIRDKEAKVKLDPTIWNLTLDVYSATPEEIKIVRNANEEGTNPTLATGGLTDLKNKKTLSGTAQVDLTKGSSTADFNLLSAPGTTAKGDVNVEINFLNPDSVRINKLVVEILKNGNPLASAVKEEIEAVAFAKAGSDGYYFHSFTKTNVPAGIYTFEIKFLDENNKVVLLNSQDIIIEGGNKSEDKIDLLDINAYGTIPTKPINLEYQTYFKPADTPIEIDANKKLYAQDITALSALEKNYKIDISWIDTADNEYGYKLLLTSTTGEVIDFTFDPTNHKTVKSTKDTVGSSKVTCEGTFGAMKKGDKKTVTLTVPLTVAFTTIEVMALNPYVHETNDKAAVTESVTPGNKIGMFTVSYNLDASGNGVNPAKSKIYYNTSGISANQYFVMGYPYGSTVDNLVKGVGKYPYVSLTNYEFGSWMKSTGSTPAFANVTNEDLTIEKLLSSGNIELRAGWLTNASINVVFPDYSVYKELKATQDNSENGNVIKPKEGKVKIILPQADVTEPEYKIYRDADNALPEKGLIYDSSVPTAGADTQLGITLAKGKVDKDTLNWDTSVFIANYPTAAGGVYRVDITYNYQTGATTYTGSLYVDFKN